ncbi:MAG: hypothetical protein LBM12_01150 [Candidatus Nomurabacteria bacterium]|jgi:DNA polymerase III delta prime subunit|nr:hypothetical protein [Candidatus Nomurabacteria bacterium]
MFLDEDADLPTIAKQFGCTIFYGDPTLMLAKFPATQTLVFGESLKKSAKKDAEKPIKKPSGITKDVAQEIVRLNTSMAASTPEKPNFLLVKNAEFLNENASNTLLKTLEESRQHIVLLARPSAQILPTILSRSAIFHLPAAKTTSSEAAEIAKLSVVEMANKLDKKPELALEVLNLFAKKLADRGDTSGRITKINNVARAIIAGNSPKLAFLAYL